MGGSGADGRTSGERVQVQDDWDFYPCNVDDHPASITLNLAYGRHAPLPDSPTVLWIGLQILEPGDHGMGVAPDLDPLYDLEDAIVDAATERGMRYVGRVRTQGDWELTFYGTADHAKDLEGLAVERLRGVDRGFRFASKEDPAWEYFSGFLFPPRERFQWIQDRRVVEQLLRHGDDVGQPRVVDHRVMFPEGVDPAGFCARAEAQGFSMHELEGDPDRTDRVFEARRADPVDVGHIHDVVMDLVELVESEGGTYDGWGCHVVKAADPGPAAS